VCAHRFRSHLPLIDIVCVPWLLLLVCGRHGGGWGYFRCFARGLVCAGNFLHFEILSLARRTAQRIKKIKTAPNTKTTAWICAEKLSVTNHFIPRLRPCCAFGSRCRFFLCPANASGYLTLTITVHAYFSCYTMACNVQFFGRL
jgi:hypothetical protein